MTRRPARVHDFGGLILWSEAALPGLPERVGQGGGDGDFAVRIALEPGKRPDAGSPVHRWQGRYGLSLDRVGDRWLVRRGRDLAIEIDPEGRNLRCRFADEAEPPLLGEVLTRRVLPRVAGLHGRLVLHAATVSDGADAVMLFGVSGAGKSTMTAAIARALGWFILADDMSILGGDLDRTAWSSMPGVSLWRGSRAGLDLPDDRCAPIPGHDGKVWYRPDGRGSAGPARLGSIVFLAEEPRGGKVHWEPVSGPAVLAMAASQLMPFNPADPDERGRMMNRLGRLLAEVPAYALAYPRSFAALPDVLVAIRSLHSDAAGRSL
ncbi:MAG: hypothetical protein ACOY4K_14915 [Pseudomonadota bacterium]